MAIIRDKWRHLQQMELVPGRVRQLLENAYLVGDPNGHYLISPKQVCFESKYFPYGVFQAEFHGIKLLHQ